MPSLPNFSCPICYSSLIIDNSTLKCDNKHHFDYAKEGYVNLLPVQLKKSLQPGDDKNMVLARRVFLQLGHYAFLQRAMSQVISQTISKGISENLANNISGNVSDTVVNDNVFNAHNKLKTFNVVDLGCGEGYYTDAVQQVLSNTISQINVMPSLEENTILVYGIDISKSACKYAAKRNKAVHYAVATNAHLPFADNSVTVIMNVFAPLVGEECRRILSNGGCIISASPGPNHLMELKRVIYDQPEQHEPPKSPSGFVSVNQTAISQQVLIDSKEALDNLLTMTPFGWKTTVEKKLRLIEAIPFEITLDFVVSTFKADEVL